MPRVVGSLAEDGSGDELVEVGLEVAASWDGAPCAGCEEAESAGRVGCVADGASRLCDTSSTRHAASFGDHAVRGADAMHADAVLDVETETCSPPVDHGLCSNSVGDADSDGTKSTACIGEAPCEEKQQPNTVGISLNLGMVTFTSLVVPDKCTVGHFKTLLNGTALLGEQVLYAHKLCFTAATGGRPLGDDSELPLWPGKCHVHGPRPVVGSLEMALTKKLGAPRKPKPNAPPKGGSATKPATNRWPHVGQYRVRNSIGSGFEGECVYSAEHRTTHDEVALKWPAKIEEVSVLKRLAEQLPEASTGIPRLLASGSHQGRPYAVTPRLGNQLNHFMQNNGFRPLDVKWRCYQIIGRMILRRLRILHDCGFVHCDISPENILFGCRRGVAENRPATLAAPYLVDFGLAREHPGGRPLRGDYGSIEWSSVRSADGGVRLPHDDIEALGWILVNGLLGQLPWFITLSEAYKEWHNQQTRKKVVQIAQFTKRKLMFEGWEALGSVWKNFGQVPKELWVYLRTCEDDDVRDDRPDYAFFNRLLGGTGGEEVNAEALDVEEFREHVIPYL